MVSRLSGPSGAQPERAAPVAAAAAAAACGRGRRSGRRRRPSPAPTSPAELAGALAERARRASAAAASDGARTERRPRIGAGRDGADRGAARAHLPVRTARPAGLAPRHGRRAVPRPRRRRPRPRGAPHRRAARAGRPRPGASPGARCRFTSWRGRPRPRADPGRSPPTGRRLALGRRRWTAPVPLLTGTAADAGRGVDLPPFLARAGAARRRTARLVPGIRRVRRGPRPRAATRCRRRSPCTAGAFAAPRTRRSGARPGAVGRRPRRVLRRATPGQPGAGHRARRAVRRR